MFPDHWSFLLGEIALFCYVVLVATGVFLTFFFAADTPAGDLRRPVRAARGAEVSAAFDSVMRLSFEVRAGLLMRQIHHWAAVVFVAAIVVHVCADLLHRRLPPAARDQLAGRRRDAAARAGGRPDRLFAAG